MRSITLCLTLLAGCSTASTSDPPPQDSGGISDTLTDGVTDGSRADNTTRDDEDTDALCSDGKDNDGDGHTDCDDFDCSKSPSVTVCIAGTEDTDALCSDGEDNDNDGHTDCDDFDCSKSDSVGVCPKEDTDALCSDGEDNDNDGHTDCDDYSCSKNPGVTICSAGDVCPGVDLSFVQKTDAYGTHHEATASGTFLSKANDYDSELCLWDQGADVVYHVQPPVSGRLAVTLSTTLAIDGEIYVFEGTCGTGEVKTHCTMATSPASTQIFRTFDGIVANEDYYVVLDTDDQAARPEFELTIVSASTP